MSSSPLLRLECVRKRFGSFEALSSISMTLQPGRVYGLAGENGAGKSTLVKILCGVHAHFEGQLELEGRSYCPRDIADAERAGIVVFHQEMPICPSLSVAANVFLGQPLSHTGLFPDWKNLERRCEKLFLELLGMPFDASRLMGECSVAERQLALLVRVLSREARLLILDEPTTALTPPEVALLFRILQRLRSQGLAILYISHLLDELVELSDEIFVLRDGALAGHRQRGEFDASTLAQLIAGRELKAVAPGPANLLRTPRLEIRNLTRAGEFRDVSFGVAAGEILGITGLQGSGRAALARALFGSPPADQGEIILNGKRVLIRSARDAIASGIGFVPEERHALGLFDDLDVKTNLGILRRRALSELGLVSGRRLRELALQMQARLRIKFSAPEAPVDSLSGGNQQKLVIGRWLTLEPQVLVMNEPTSGVDVGAKEEICRLMRTLAEQGCSFVVCTSDLEELINLADRILTMNSGQITGEFFRASFRKHDLIHAVGATKRAHV